MQQRLAIPFFIALSITLSLALFVVRSGPTTTIVEAAPSFSNRIILIRHAEKGPQESLNPHSVDQSEPGLRKRREPWGAGHLEAESSGVDGDRPSGGRPSRGPPGRDDDGGGRPPWGSPGSGGKGKFPSGLSDQGRERAQCLRTVFGNESEYNIGLIFAAPRDPPKETERTYATVSPLAEDLGVEIDIECANADASCIVAKVNAFAERSDADVLISWKHFDLNIIATALGATNAHTTYPDDRFDLIWTLEDGAIVSKRSQHCPGLDDGRVDEGDPDCAIEAARSGSVGSWRSWTLWAWVRGVCQAIMARGALNGRS